MFYPSQEYAPIGSLKARYRPLGLVAQGQFGKVYCAVHRASGRLVALKLLDRHRSTTSQFLRELSSLLTLRHPALIQLRAIEQTDAGRCLVLDYSSGGTLRQLLESSSQPRQELILQGMVQVLEGLAHAHARGIIHCDVKPENILMQPHPQGWHACLTDFGIAQNHGESHSISSDPAFERGGSPAYMAPERFAGEAYGTSDLYSMGIILYEVLLGDRPFHGSPNALREAHRQAAIEFPQSLDVAFQKLLYRSLSKAPDLRHQSAKTMAIELRQALEVTFGSTTRANGKLAAESETNEPRRNHQRLTAFTHELFQAITPEALIPWPQESTAKHHRFEQKPEDNPQTHGFAILPCASQEPEAQEPEGTFPRLCFFHGAQLQVLSLESLLAHPEDDWHLHNCLSLQCPREIIQLALTPRHGFAVTESALYRWFWKQGNPSGAFTNNAPAERSNAAQADRGHPDFHCLIQGQTGLDQIVLSPQGQWVAIVQQTGQAQQKISPQQTISPQTRSQPTNSQQPDALLLANLRREQSRPLAWRKLQLQPNETLMGVQLLDRRHGAALLSTTGSTQRLALFSRRGQWLNSFSLPVLLQFWAKGSQPYELWGIEAEHPQVLLKLGLKPFRVQRIPLAIAPDQIYAVSWGIILINQAGELLLLNRDGQSLGQLQVPLSDDAHQLWLTPISSNLLMVVMQRSQQWQCLTLDLRDLDLMLVL